MYKLYYALAILVLAGTGIYVGLPDPPVSVPIIVGGLLLMALVIAAVGRALQLLLQIREAVADGEH